MTKANLSRRGMLASAAAVLGAIGLPAGATAGDPLANLILRYRAEVATFNAWALSPAGLQADADEHEAMAARYVSPQDLLWQTPPMPTTDAGAAFALEEFASYFGQYDLRSDDPLLQIVIAYLRKGGAA